MMRRGAVIFLLTFAAIISCSRVNAQVLEQDSLALIDFYISTDGPDWLIPWDTATQVNEWFGVILTESNSRVGGIALPNNQLTGQLPTSLSNLDKLSSLDLSDNQIGGKIPSELGILNELIILNLSGNTLSDTIPEEIGSMKFLKTLDLSNNDLQGNIPSTIGNIDSLRNLNLSQNQISGLIPSTIANLDSLNTFNLASNSISGSIPDYLQNLKELREIDLSNNELTGELPALWAQLQKLRTLRLNNNLLEGELPLEIMELSTLFTLDISNNTLDGRIPDEIGNLDSLRILDLSGNKLTHLPPLISNLKKLERLDVSENEISGILPSLIGISDQLRILDMHANKFTGIIPASFGSIVSLVTMNLSGNNLVETLPGSFVNLVNLETLNISNNKISNLTDITDLGVSGSLQSFNVRNNSLEFDDLELNYQLFNSSNDYSPQARINDTLNIAVPTGNTHTLTVEASGSSNLYRWVLESKDSLVQTMYKPENFELAIDNFQEQNSGSYTCEIISSIVPGLVLKRNPINLFPAINTVDSLALIQFNIASDGENWINKWEILSEPVFTWDGVIIESGTVVGLDLENNNLQGELSDSLGLLENLRVLDLSGNELEDSIPSLLGDLIKLEVLDLSNNNMIGMIPEAIGGLENLRTLDLSSNNFEDSIPGAIGGLQGLVAINLSRNRITGNIPDTFSDLTSLVTVNLSRNNLNGILTSQFNTLLSLRELDLSNNDFVGEIPADLSSLQLLEILALGENQFEGEIPDGLGELVNLQNLDLSENRLTGSIPEAIAGLPNLEELKLFRNQLSGELPEIFTTSLSLERLFINDNRLTTLPVLSDFQFNNLELRVFNNFLTFDDLVDNFNGFSNFGREDEFLFLPQPTIINMGSQTLARGDSLILEIPDIHPESKYSWQKEGTDLGVGTRQLQIDSAIVLSSGIYLGSVWTGNPIFNSATDSLVFSFAFTVLVPPPTPEVDEPEPFCIGDERITLVNGLGTQSGLITRWYDDHPQSGSEPFSEASIVVHNVNQESDTLFVTNGLAINKEFESQVDTAVIISRPWIIDRGEFLEVAPSDSLLNTRFKDNSFVSTYQWFVNDELAIGETDRTIQKSEGSRFHVRVVRGGCSSTSLVYILPEENLILGISEDTDTQLTLYPNPATSRIVVNGLNDTWSNVKMTVMDLEGHQLINEGIGNPAGTFEIDVSTLSPGLYVLNLISGEKYWVGRFVKN